MVPALEGVLERLAQTRWKYYNLHPDAAAFLRLLAHMVRARNILEIGTANGYSAIVLGSAVRERGGKVTTIERNGGLVKEARHNITEAGLADIVTVIPGSAFKVLKDVHGPYDFAFLDATKQEYAGYWERVKPLLAPRALLVADNLLSHESELVEFRAAVAEDERLDALILPIGTGLLVGVAERG